MKYFVDDEHWEVIGHAKELKKQGAIHQESEQILKDYYFLQEIGLVK